MLKAFVGTERSGEPQSWAPLLLPTSVPTSSSKKAKMTSYKEMWQNDNALSSLATTSLYEAGGSIYWVDLLARDSLTEDMSGATISQVQNAMSLFSTRLCKDDRLIYPAVLDVFVGALAELPRASEKRPEPAEGPNAKSKQKAPGPDAAKYPRSLTLIAGHTVLYAYWFALYQALQEATAHPAGVDALLQAGLTVTLRCHLIPPEERHRVARIALGTSETLRTLEAAGETFLMFCDRLIVLTKGWAEGTIANTLARLKKEGVLYQGKPISRNLLAAAEAFSKQLTPEARSTLRYIESKFGKGVITDGPTKLYRLTTACSKAGASQVQETVEQVVFLLSIALDLDVLQPARCSAENLTGKEGRECKPTSAEQVPYVSIALAQWQLLQHCHNVVALMDRCPPNFSKEIVDFLLPARFRTMLSKAAQADDGTTFDAASQACLAQMRARFSETELKQVGPTLEWAFSVIDGQLNDSVRSLALLDDADFAKEMRSDASEHEVVKEFQEALKTMNQQNGGPTTDLSWKDLVDLGGASKEDADLRKMFRKQEKEDGARRYPLIFTSCQFRFKACQVVECSPGSLEEGCHGPKDPGHSDAGGQKGPRRLRAVLSAVDGLLIHGQPELSVPHGPSCLRFVRGVRLETMEWDAAGEQHENLGAAHLLQGAGRVRCSTGIFLRHDNVLLLRWQEQGGPTVAARMRILSVDARE